MTYVLDPVIHDSRHAPRGNRVLVDILPPEETGYKGIIQIADTAKDAPIWGTVVAVGPGVDVEELDGDDTRLVPGAKVIFARYGGHQLELKGGHRIAYLEENDIIGVLHPKSE